MRSIRGSFVAESTAEEPDSTWIAPALVAVLITNLYLDVARKRSAGRVKASLTLAVIVSDETCSLEINREMSMPWNGSREDAVAQSSHFLCYLMYMMFYASLHVLTYYP